MITIICEIHCGAAVIMTSSSFGDALTPPQSAVHSNMSMADTAVFAEQSRQDLQRTRSLLNTTKVPSPVTRCFHAAVARPLTPPVAANTPAATEPMAPVDPHCDASESRARTGSPVARQCLIYNRLRESTVVCGVRRRRRPGPPLTVDRRPFDLNRSHGQTSGCIHP